MPPSSVDDEDPPREPNALERVALVWLARIDRGLSRQEAAEFERWLAADVRHATLFGEFEGTWSLMDRMGDFPTAGAAMAAESDSATTERAAPAAPFNAGAPQAAASVGTRRHRRRALRLTLTAAAACVVGVAWIGWNVNQRQPPEFHHTAREETRIGEVRAITLPDGSVVRLNTDSTAEIRYHGTGREVQLRRGEAHFTIARDGKRPFTVTASGVAVRAVGTAFNVRVRAESVDILVTEGRVQVREDTSVAGLLHAPADPTPSGTSAGSASQGTALAAGQAIAVPREGRVSDAGRPVTPETMTPVEIQRALAWQERRLDFVSVPLSTMVAEFNRYNRHKLVIVDSELENQHFGGSFHADDPTGFVRVLETNFRVVAEPREGETHLRAAP